MSFATGYSINQDTLVTLLAAFAVAEGYTQNQQITKNTGLLANLQVVTSGGNAIFLNLRSANNESMPNNVASPLTGVGLTMSTGYNASDDFYNQPGGPTDTTNSNRYWALTINNTSSIATYWIFGYTNPDLICCVAQLPSGIYKHIAFGDMTKTSPFPGGHFIFASNGVFNVGTPVQSGLPFEHNDINEGLSNTGIMRVDLDNRAGWWGSAGSRGTGSNVINFSNFSGAIAGALFIDHQLLSNAGNVFSGLGLLNPTHLFAHFVAANKMKYIGHIEWMRTCQLAAFVPGQIFTIGPDSWIAFPSVTATGPFGIAYRYIP